MGELETRLQQAQVDWDIHHPRKSNSNSQPQVGDKRNATVMMAEEKAHAVAVKDQKTSKRGDSSRILCSKCKKMGWHTPEMCWKGTKCATCGEEHPTLKHEKAVSMRKIKAEQASSDTKVNISSLYGNGRK